MRARRPGEVGEQPWVVCAPRQPGRVGPLHGCLVPHGRMKQSVCLAVEVLGSFKGGRQSAEAGNQLVELLHKIDRHGCSAWQTKGGSVGSGWDPGATLGQLGEPASRRSARRAPARLGTALAVVPRWFAEGWPASVTQHGAVLQRQGGGEREDKPTAGYISFTPSPSLPPLPFHPAPPLTAARCPHQKHPSRCAPFWSAPHQGILPHTLSPLTHMWKGI